MLQKIYLIYIKNDAEIVEVGVQGAQHVDHLHGCSGGADGREAHDVAEEHCDIVNLFRFHTLTWINPEGEMR